MVLSSASFSQRKPAVVANALTDFWSPGNHCAFTGGGGAVGSSATTLQHQVLGVQNYLSAYNVLLTYTRTNFLPTSVANTALCITTSPHT